MIIAGVSLYNKKKFFRFVLSSTGNVIEACWRGFSLLRQLSVLILESR